MPSDLKKTSKWSIIWFGGVFCNCYFARTKVEYISGNSSSKIPPSISFFFISKSLFYLSGFWVLDAVVDLSLDDSLLLSLLSCLYNIRNVERQKVLVRAESNQIKLKIQIKNKTKQTQTHITHTYHCHVYCFLIHHHVVHLNQMNCLHHHHCNWHHFLLFVLLLLPIWIQFCLPISMFVLCFFSLLMLWFFSFSFHSFRLISVRDMLSSLSLSVFLLSPLSLPTSI